MKTILFLIIALFSAQTMAFDELKFRPYVGVFGGFNHLKGDTNEANKNGYNIGGKADASFLNQDFIFDTGIGWQYNSMSGSEKNIDVTIKTWSIFLDADTKYRVTENVSVGPAMQIHLGTDHTYAESLNQKSTTVLAGARVAYDTKLDTKYLRYTAEVLHNLTNTGRSNIVMNVGISIGFDVFDKKEAPRTVIKPRDDGNLKFTLKFARIGFDTDNSTLDSEAKQKLYNLGVWLKNNSNRYGRLKINGHTDPQGGKEYNDKLSQDRADAVVKILLKAGVADSKMQAKGYGYSQPLDNRNTPEAWEKNRRTEIEFFDVIDRKEFNEMLIQLLK